MCPARSPQASGFDRISDYDLAYADSVPNIRKIQTDLIELPNVSAEYRATPCIPI
jgi:hypothetical protein